MFVTSEVWAFEAVARVRVLASSRRQPIGTLSMTPRRDFGSDFRARLETAFARFDATAGAHDRGARWKSSAAALAWLGTNPWRQSRLRVTRFLSRLDHKTSASTVSRLLSLLRDVCSIDARIITPRDRERRSASALVPSRAACPMR
jgi:hypothetical protein